MSLSETEVENLVKTLEEQKSALILIKHDLQALQAQINGKLGQYLKYLSDARDALACDPPRINVARERITTVIHYIEAELKS